LQGFACPHKHLQAVSSGN